MTSTRHTTFVAARAAVRTSLLVCTAAAALALTACAVPVTRTTRVYEDPAIVAVAPVAQYGIVRRIEVIETTQQPGGGGTALGALIGGVVGNQFGRAAATALGVFGGAVIGNNAERQQAAVNSNTVYRVVVAFDNGATRSFDNHALNGLHAGERVRLEDGLIYRA